MNLPGKSAMTLGVRWLLGIVLIWAALGQMVGPQDFFGQSLGLPAPPA